MFCPKCKFEYRARFTVCSDCQVQLVPELSQEALTEPLIGNSIIEITRTNTRTGHIRRYSIIVDGHKVTSIRYGQTISIPIEPGQHSIHAEIDWFKSNKLQFEISANQTLKILIVNRPVTSLKYWAALIFFCLCIALGAIFGAFGIGIIGGIGGTLYSITVGNPYIRTEP